MRRPCGVVRIIGVTAGLILTVGGGALAWSAEPEGSTGSAFQRANELYRRARCAEAASGYRAMLNTGTESGALYYNLGNALLKSGRTGEARWAYLNATRLLPRDPDVAANLAYATSLLEAGAGASFQPPRWVRWVTLGGRFSARELSGWLGWALWLFAVAWIGAAWIPGLRSTARPLVWIGGSLIAILAASLVTQTVWIDRVPRAVVIRDETEAKFAPQEIGTTHFTLSEGTVLRVLGREHGWVQVKRIDGRAGWVPEQAVASL